MAKLESYYPYLCQHFYAVLVQIWMLINLRALPSSVDRNQRDVTVFEAVTVV